MKSPFTFLLTLLLAAAPFCRSQAQAAGQPTSQPTGQLTGQLLDERQQPLPFATVVLRQVRDTTWVRGAVAQADGRYAFAGLAPGQYRLTVIMLGYQGSSQKTEKIAR